ncbi:MAG: helix-turn-helix domain-containing protein [Syntrophaceae bacterium]
MEKISIVKRRKNEPLEYDIDSHELSDRELMVIPTGVFDQSPSNVINESLTLDESNGDIHETISINLTPDQYNLVQSSQYIKYFLDGESTGVSLDMQKPTEGQIIFNFQFKRVETVKTLKSNHVCQMLQISIKSLMKLVKAKKIKSYKIGRLRRFLLQDILDYLSRCEEVCSNSRV